MGCLLSVVIAAYNAQRVLDTCLESFAQLPLGSYEVIVVDDGSTDETLAVAQHFAARHAFTRVIHQENGGVSCARNNGMAAAEGDYLFFADADDWVEPDQLAALVKAAAENDADMAYGDYYRESQGAARWCQLFPNDFCSADKETFAALQCAAVYVPASRFSCRDFDCIMVGGGSCWRYVMKRSFAKTAGLVFDNVLSGYMEDSVFTLHALEYARKVMYRSVPFYHYRVQGDSLCHRYFGDYEQRFSAVNRALDAILQGAGAGREQLAQAVYLKRIHLLGLAMDGYFNHPNNSESEQARKAAFAHFAKSEPYASAVKNVRLKWVGNKKVAIQVALLKLGCVGLYWDLRK